MKDWEWDNLTIKVFSCKTEEIGGMIGHNLVPRPILLKLIIADSLGTRLDWACRQPRDEARLGMLTA